MKSRATTLILFTSLLYDIVSAALFLSHQSEVKQENDFLSLICRDKDTGAAASWRGPKNRRLGEKTNPQARTTSYGVQLIFNKIRKEDAGTYTCNTKLEKAEFTLFVEGPIVFVDTPSEQQGQEGSDIILKCEARGGSITWLVDGEPPKGPKYQIIGDGLLVQNATKEDAKTYICKAVSEGIGTMKDKSIDLKVTHGPRLPPNTPERHYMKEEIVYGFIGGTVNLTCEVEAEPPPAFRWFDKSNKKKIGEEITGSSPYQSVLMLKMTWKNLGDYKCRAENQYGTLDVLFRLLNGSQPNPPTSLKLKEANSNTLTIEIDGPEPTEEEINSQMVPLGYRLEYKAVDGNESDWMAESFALTEDKTYVLRELEHSTQYEVRAATENRAGLSDFTNTSIFKTEPNSGDRVNSNIPSIASVIVSILLIVLNGLFDNHI